MPPEAPEELVPLVKDGPYQPCTSSLRAVYAYTPCRVPPQSVLHSPSSRPPHYRIARNLADACSIEGNAKMCAVRIFPYCLAADSVLCCTQTILHNCERLLSLLYQCTLCFPLPTLSASPLPHTLTPHHHHCRTHIPPCFAVQSLPPRLLLRPLPPPLPVRLYLQSALRLW
jgi:hypothetical protein